MSTARLSSLLTSKKRVLQCTAIGEAVIGCTVAGGVIVEHFHSSWHILQQLASFTSYLPDAGIVNGSLKIFNGVFGLISVYQDSKKISSVNCVELLSGVQLIVSAIASILKSSFSYLFLGYVISSMIDTLLALDACLENYVQIRLASAPGRLDSRQREIAVKELKKIKMIYL